MLEPDVTEESDVVVTNKFKKQRMLLCFLSVTGLPEQRPKLSRKACYCDSFAGAEAKVVKKSLLL
ncbi:hypothetical protein [Mesobacillus jeotgali]|uniref:hypothetical protein n=1 Tax=Mesobacillus jeotgali TaxID=129985 RepID=UPI00178278EB|nr:hypothetical protein [Mesobacillus jeotgali]UYZ23960.1 hypothetical protein FOF60_10680 [Mesobacillus jeotgali]